MSLKFLSNQTTDNKIGIGTNVPLANLDISNNAGSVYQQWSYDNSPGSSANNYNLTLSETVTSGNVRFCFNQKNAGTTYSNVLVFNQGNVGIGTDSPDYKLEVQGVISSADAGLQKATFANVGNDLVLTANADATNVTAKMLFNSSGAGGAGVSTKMIIDGAGKVGIGTITLGTYKLNVAGTGYYSNQLTVDGFTNDAGISFRNGFTPTNTGIRAKAIGTANRDGVEVLGYNGIDLSVNNGANVAMRIVGVTGSGMGNVGIGTTSPDSLLEISKAQASGPILKLKEPTAVNGTLEGGPGNNLGVLGFVSSDTSTSQGNLIRASVEGQPGEKQYGTGGLLTFNTMQTYAGSGTLTDLIERMRITSGGNVGIGETNPDRKLHVNSGSDNANTIFESTDTAVTIRLKDLTGSAEIESRNDFRFSNNAGVDQRMVISTTGAIKFNNYDSTNNTGTPTYLLGTDASGNIVKTNTVPGSAAGPYLPLAGGTMTAGAVVTFLDSSGSTDDRLKFGSGGDMQLFHDGTASHIVSSGSDLRIDVPNFIVRSASGTESIIRATQNAAVELYYDNSKKFETTSTGVTVTGGLTTTDDITISNTSPELYLTNTNALKYNWMVAAQENVDQAFEITPSTVVGGSTYNAPALKIDGSTSNATFAGDVSLGDNKELIFGAATDFKIYHNSTTNVNHVSSQLDRQLSINGNIINLTNQANSTTYLKLESTGATFAGNVFPSTNGGGSLGLGSNQWSGLDLTSSSSITWANGDASILEGEVGGYSLSFNVYNGSTTMERVLLLEKTKAATFSGQAFATTATSTGDASSTLTTKGYVDGLITGATIYRGTWDPDITANSGNGTPDLSTVTQTSGYYYICSDIGTAHPNGTTGSPAVPCEPNSWAVGDWVIWNDDVPDCAGTGTGAWQKIDNTSVLSGVGTGQTVALWEGAGSVTDSETLGNAPITVSGNNSTFAGNVTVGALTSGETAQLIVNQEGGVAPVAKLMSRTNKAIVQISDNDTTGYVSSENGYFSLGSASGVNAANINIATANSNVGIGVTATSDGDLTLNAPKLHVKGTDTSGAYNLVARFQGGNDADSTGAAILINHSNDRGLLIEAGRKDGDREVAYFNVISSGATVTPMLTMGKFGSDYNVGIGTTTPQSKLQVAGGIQMADDTDTAVVGKVGTMRYRTATDEPVPITGTDLVTNGDLASSTGWYLQNSASINNTTGVATVPAGSTYSGAISATGGNWSLYQQNVMDPSKTYMLRFQARRDAGPNANMYAGWAYQVVFSQTVTAAWVQYQVVFTTGTQAWNELTFGGVTGTTFEVKDISVVEVTEEDASYADMCMQTGASTYEWVNIVRNTY